MKVYLEDTSLTAIADAIREKNGETTAYKPAEMADAIAAIETGGAVEDNYDYSAIQTITISNVDTHSLSLADYLDGTEKIIAISATFYPAGSSAITNYRAGVYRATVDGVQYFDSFTMTQYAISPETQGQYMAITSNVLRGQTYYSSALKTIKFRKVVIYCYKVKEGA